MISLPLGFSAYDPGPGIRLLRVRSMNSLVLPLACKKRSWSDPLVVYMTGVGIYVIHIDI